MKTVFIGGSRRIPRLPAEVKDRLSNLIGNGHRVVVGDANGADKAVQKYLLDSRYEDVIVFCSGNDPRNNLGHWQVCNIEAPQRASGFEFYAVKDREMARKADFGLMIWDGKSVGTILNILRLVRLGKIAVLIDVQGNKTLNFRSMSNWNDFLRRCSAAFRSELQDRATSDEWEPLTLESNQPSLLGDIKTQPPETTINESPSLSESDLAAINAALASKDSALVVETLGDIARARGMTQVAKEAGLARESLYRSLGDGGNPEFSTVVKVMAAIGLRLEVSQSPVHKKG